jgi:hypothetical protein
MSYELFREDYHGVDLKPFATVPSGADAESAARNEIVEGDAQSVVVHHAATLQYVGTLYIAAYPDACAVCGDQPVENSMIWGIGDNLDHRYYCSVACVQKAQA